MIQEDIVKKFFRGTGGSYDLIVNLFTYGADVYWKRQILSKIVRPKQILDLACGTGILTSKLARKFPQSKMIGVDMMFEYLIEGRKKNLPGSGKIVQWICGRAEEVKLHQTFDCITASYLPKYLPAQILLKNITPLLKDDGILVLHDFTYPTKAIFRKLWHLHVFWMKRLGSPLFPEWRTVFDELDELICQSQWLSEYESELRKHGIVDIKTQHLTAGSAAILSARKKIES